MSSMTMIDARNLPRHVAIIMDGNGRWAELRGRPRTVGHRAGSHAVRRVVRAARRLGIQQLTLYAFSEQNWGRPDEEVDALMGLLQEYLTSERDEILDNGIHLRAVGNVEKLPPHVRTVLDELSQRSVTNRSMVLSLALSYGGREEITASARQLATRVRNGELNPEDITEDMLRAGIPSVSFGDPDLLIRTGGELRISNFLLWGAAYAELHFSRSLWPDYGVEDLYEAIAAYQARQRRFGLVPSRAPITSSCPTSFVGS
jgi:undecaprenyl diphosphate synthase